MGDHDEVVRNFIDRGLSMKSRSTVKPIEGQNGGIPEVMPFDYRFDHLSPCGQYFNFDFGGGSGAK